MAGIYVEPNAFRTHGVPTGNADASDNMYENYEVSQVYENSIPSASENPKQEKEINSNHENISPRTTTKSNGTDCKIGLIVLFLIISLVVSALSVVLLILRTEDLEKKLMAQDDALKDLRKADAKHEGSSDNLTTQASNLSKAFQLLKQGTPDGVELISILENMTKVTQILQEHHEKMNADEVTRSLKIANLTRITQVLQENMKIINATTEENVVNITNLDVSLRLFSELATRVPESGTELKSYYEKNPDKRDDICYMGMKSGAILDSAITASSESDPARKGRLDYEGCWSPTRGLIGEWIQIDMGRPKLVAGVISQGSGNTFEGVRDWVTLFKVSCGLTEKDMATITENGAEKIFIGNTDLHTKVVNKFPQLMACRYIRVYPQAASRWWTMRLEFIRGNCSQFY